MYTPFKSYDHSKKATALSYFFNLLSIIVILAAVILVLFIGKRMNAADAFFCGAVLIGGVLLFRFGCTYTDSIAMKELEKQRKKLLTRKS